MIATPSLDQALENIFKKDMQAISRAQQSEFARLVPADLDTLILFGTGWMGKNTAIQLRRLSKKYRLFFCDNNPAITGEVMGIPVLSKEEAFTKYGQSALFVVTIFNGEEVLAQLKAAGCKYVISYVVLYRGYPELMPHCSLSYPHPLAENEADIRTVYQMLADDQSRREMIELLEWHTSESYYLSPRPHPVSEIYFAPDIVRLNAHERYVDCGAFDGDSIQNFLQQTGGKIDRVAGFEPIEGIFARLSKYRDGLPPELREKVDIYPYAIAASRGLIYFSADGMASSAINGDCTVEVQAVTLDEQLADFHPTFIKMDLEGVECEALAGAKTLLKQDAPILTITLYHDMRHLWEVPLLIRATNPDYKFYLRRYAADCWETVCYAIPPNRQI